MKNLIIFFLALISNFVFTNISLAMSFQEMFYEKKGGMLSPVIGAVSSERITVFHNINPELRNNILDDGIVKLEKDFDPLKNVNAFHVAKLKRPKIGEKLSGELKLLDGKVVFIEVVVVQDEERLHQSAVVISPTEKSYPIEPGTSGTLLTCHETGSQGVILGALQVGNSKTLFLAYGSPRSSKALKNPIDELR